MDEHGRFKLDDETRSRLRAIWDSPADYALLLDIKNQVMAHIVKLLRTCNKDSIEHVRGALDMMDWWFNLMDRSVKEEIELPADQVAAPRGI